jgi:hypothetical protein
MGEPRGGASEPEPAPFRRVVEAMGLRDEETGEPLTFPVGVRRRRTVEELLLVPPTDLVQKALGIVEAALDALSDFAPERRGMADERQRLEALLLDCAERDRLREGRPAGCWCLGQGGRWRAYLADGTPVWKSERLLPGGGHEPLVDAFCDCEDGQRARAETAAAVAEHAARARAERVARRLEAAWGGATVPRAYRQYTLEGYVGFVRRHAPEAAPIAEGLVRRLELAMAPPARWAVLSGSYGRGKTALALGCLRLAIERGATGLFVVVPDLLMKLRATYGREKGPTDEELMAGLLAADVLVLDDLGKETVGRDGTVSAWTAERLFMLINGRYLDDAKVTIVTSNATLEELGERLGDAGEAITQRIQQRARGMELDVSALPNLREFSDEEDDDAVV